MNKVANDREEEQLSYSSIQHRPTFPPIELEMRPLEPAQEQGDGQTNMRLSPKRASAAKSGAKRVEDLIASTAKSAGKRVEELRASGAKRVEDLSRRQLPAEGNPEEEEGGKRRGCLQRFNELTHNKWFWIGGGSILVSVIVTIVVVLNFVVLLPKTAITSSSQTVLPRTGETMVTKKVAVKDVELFSANKQFSSLVAFVEPPAAGGRRLQEGQSMPAKLEMSHPQMGVTVVGWGPNQFEVRVNPDQLLAFFEESAASRRLQSEDRTNNSFAFDDGAALEKAIQELIVEVVSSATGRSAAEMEVDYQEKFVGVYDPISGVYSIQERREERRLLLSFHQLLAPVKALMATYVSQTVENMKKYGPQIAQTAGAVYTADTVLTYPGENHLMEDPAELNLTRNLQTVQQQLLFQIVSRQAYDNFAACEGPKERRVCDREGFSDPDRGQFVASWPADPQVSASYRVVSKDSPYASPA